MTTLHQETHFQVLRLLESNPHMNQRELAVALGVSLGKTNFCLRALLDKGLVKVQNFQNNKQKLTYAYVLSSAVFAEKSALTKRFLTRKLAEIEMLKRETEVLKWEGGP
jgi:EPS-associated MarR family transcriptional regulator